MPRATCPFLDIAPVLCALLCEKKRKIDNFYRHRKNFSGWETKNFWHSPELGSLLYSQYKIPLAQACFPLARPNFHSHWRAGERYSFPTCFWAFTGPKIDFGLILLISNMIIHRSFNGLTHLLTANVRGPVGFAAGVCFIIYFFWI